MKNQINNRQLKPMGTILHTDPDAIFTLHSNLDDLIVEMETNRRSVATAVGNITETTWTDDQSKKFFEHFEEDMRILKKLHSEMEEKLDAIKALGDAIKAYEEINL